MVVDHDIPNAYFLWMPKYCLLNSEIWIILKSITCYCYLEFSFTWIEQGPFRSGSAAPLIILDIFGSRCKFKLLGSRGA